MPLFLPWIIDTAPGASNWGVGQRAGDSITTGSNNIAIGDDALTAGTTGSNNVAIGTSTIGDNPSFSVAIGSSALAVGGSQNVAIGYQALIGTNAVGNVAIGYRAGDNIPVSSGAALNILIGHSVDAPTSTETGQISIGNLIYGFIPFGGYFGGSTVSDGNVGIGVPTASFPSAGTLGLFFADGTAPSGLASNTAGIYANDVGGTVQMFAINEAGTSYQLTAAPTLEVRDETVSQGSASVLDFVGAGVTAAVAAGVATITVGAASVSSPVAADYATGTFTLATGKFGLQGRRLELSSSERATLEGTAQLILSGASS